MLRSRSPTFCVYYRSSPDFVRYHCPPHTTTHLLPLHFLAFAFTFTFTTFTHHTAFHVSAVPTFTVTVICILLHVLVRCWLRYTFTLPHHGYPYAVARALPRVHAHRSACYYVPLPRTRSALRSFSPLSCCATLPHPRQFTTPTRRTTDFRTAPLRAFDTPTLILHCTALPSRLRLRHRLPGFSPCATTRHHDFAGYLARLHVLAAASLPDTHVSCTGSLRTHYTRTYLLHTASWVLPRLPYATVTHRAFAFTLTGWKFLVYLCLARAGLRHAPGLRFAHTVLCTYATTRLRILRTCALLPTLGYLPLPRVYRTPVPTTPRHTPHTYTALCLTVGTFTSTQFFYGLRLFTGWLRFCYHRTPCLIIHHVYLPTPHTVLARYTFAFTFGSGLDFRSRSSPFTCGYGCCVFFILPLHARR